MRPPLSIVFGVVTSHFRATRKEIESPFRGTDLARCRHVAIYLARKLNKSSFHRIGQYVHRDHSTVQYAVRKISREILRDQDLAREIKDLENQIIAHTGALEGKINEESQKSRLHHNTIDCR